MEGIQTQQPLPSPSEQDQGHPGSQTEQQLTQQQIQQLQQHLPQGTAEDAARVLAQMDQSLLDQVNAYAQHAQASNGVPDAATAAAMAAAAAVPPGAPLPSSVQALAQRRPSRTSSGVSRVEDDDEKRQKRRLANREAARRMRSRRQQQATSLTEEVGQLRVANQQLLERLQLATQQHQEAAQQVNLLRNELLTLKQTLGACFPMRTDGSAAMQTSAPGNGMPINLIPAPAHLYSQAMRPPGGAEGQDGVIDIGEGNPDTSTHQGNAAGMESLANGNNQHHMHLDGHDNSSQLAPSQLPDAWAGSGMHGSTMEQQTA